MYVLPLLGTVGIILPKIGKAVNERKKRKARGAKEKEEKQQNDGELVKPRSNIQNGYAVENMR